MRLARLVLTGVGILILGIATGVALGQYKCARDREHISQILYYGTEDEAKCAAARSVREFTWFLEAVSPTAWGLVEGQPVASENRWVMLEALGQSEVTRNICVLWANGAGHKRDPATRRACVYGLWAVWEDVKLALTVMKKTAKYEREPAIRTGKEAFLTDLYDFCHKEGQSPGVSDASLGSPEPEDASPPSQDGPSGGNP